MSRAPSVLLEQLDDHHVVSAFISGDEMPDAWLRRHTVSIRSGCTAV